MHQPVLLREVVELMAVRDGGVYVDGTLGAGGHTEAILRAAGETGRVLALDRDAVSLARTRSRLSHLSGHLTCEHGNFADMTSFAQTHSFVPADGVLMDLGFSSDQMDDASRGFSFMQDGPLDMRLDRSRGPSAADLVNTLGESELADVIWKYGEEKDARRIARSIVEARGRQAIRTTGELANVVAGAKRGPRGRINPATQTFQALRIEVNRELEALEKGLDAALRIVGPKGRVAVISFHSLEDRMVKQFFAAHAGRWESLEAGGERWVGEEPKVRLVTKKPVMATDEEVKTNPRARSAKLRVAERIS